MKIKLLGLYQPRNASVVISAVDILRGRGMNIPEDALLEGLEKASWAGRFEIISNEPQIIFDGAHNAQGIDSAVRSIKHYFKDERVYVLSGVLSDKDYNYIAERLSEVAERAFTLTPENPRALTAEKYASILAEKGVDATPCENITAAFNAARDAAKRNGKALVCLGSLYTYADVYALV